MVPENIGTKTGNTYVLQWQQYYFFVITRYLWKLFKSSNWQNQTRLVILNFTFNEFRLQVHFKLKKVTCLNNILCQYRLWMNYFALCVYTVTFTFKSFSVIFSWHIDHIIWAINGLIYGWYEFYMNFTQHQEPLPILLSFGSHLNLVNLTSHFGRNYDKLIIMTVIIYTLLFTCSGSTWTVQAR